MLGMPYRFHVAAQDRIDPCLVTPSLPPEVLQYIGIKPYRNRLFRAWRSDLDSGPVEFPFIGIPFRFNAARFLATQPVPVRLSLAPLAGRFLQRDSGDRFFSHLSSRGGP